MRRTLTIVATAAFTGSAAAEDTPAVLRVPVRVQVAVCDAAHPDTPLMPQAWVAEHTQAAAAIFARHGVVLELEVALFRPSQCEFDGVQQRNSLAQYVKRDGRATALVVARVPDLQMAGYDLHGVHWRYSGTEEALKGTRWVFLTARAQPPVLAHELGHFFGLAHDPQGGNLMTPGPSSPKAKGAKPFAPVFTPAQVTRLRAGVVRFLETGQ